jgi:hypothetical protein
MSIGSATDRDGIVEDGDYVHEVLIGQSFGEALLGDFGTHHHDVLAADGEPGHADSVSGLGSQPVRKDDATPATQESDQPGPSACASGPASRAGL